MVMKVQELGAGGVAPNSQLFCGWTPPPSMGRLV